MAKSNKRGTPTLPVPMQDLLKFCLGEETRTPRNAIEMALIHDDRVENIVHLIRRTIRQKEKEARQNGSLDFERLLSLLIEEAKTEDGAVLAPYLDLAQVEAHPPPTNTPTFPAPANN